MKILYVTDGFPAADHARALLAGIADRGKVEVTAMSVTQTGIPTLEQLPISLDPIEQRRADTEKIVDAAVADLQKEGFETTGRSAEGHPGQEIVRVIEADGYGLTVMGAGSRSWLGQKLLGSVSTYVLHSSPASVMIVHETNPGSSFRILLGTDGSRDSELATTCLAEMADPERCAITALAVAPSAPMLLPTLGGTAVYGPDVLEKLDKDVAERAEGFARDAASRLADAGFKTDHRVAHGHPTEQLLDVVEEGSFDLLSVGSRGSGPLGRALLRSVSDQVVRHTRATLVARQLVD